MASALTNLIRRIDFQAFTAGSAAAIAGCVLATWTGAAAVGLAALGCLKWYQDYREAQQMAEAFRSLKPDDEAEKTRLKDLLKSKLILPYHYTLFKEAISLRDAFPLHKLPDAVAVNTFSLLPAQDLRSLDRVCSWTHKQVQKECENRYRNLQIDPASLPAGMNQKQFLLTLFDAIGADFIKERLGDPGPFPPIPVNFIQGADPKFRLVPVPKTIKIKLPNVVLDESAAVGRKQARLIAGSAPIRELEVPVTVNNILFLWRLLKPQFAGLNDVGGDVIEREGDIGIDESYWSYQRKGLIGLGEDYPDQEALARAQNLQVVSLLERLWWHFLSNLHSGNVPQTDKSERTSTITTDPRGGPLQSGIWFGKTRDSRFHLSLDNVPYHLDWVGVAVGMSPRSS